MRSSDLHKIERWVAQGSGLTHRPVRQIIESIGTLSQKWLKADYFFRKIALRQLSQRSGLSEAMARAALDGLFKELTSTKLKSLLTSELGDPGVLDGFQKDALSGIQVMARGPRAVLHIFASNVPGPAVQSLILGMLVKSTNLIKLSSQDAGFLGVYIESLKEHDPGLAKAVRILEPSFAKKHLKSLAALAGCVVAYGNEDSLHAIHSQVSIETTFCGYGHKTSLGLYAKEVLSAEGIAQLAKKTALDIWSMDQRGCLSPQTIYIEKRSADTGVRFAERLAVELERLAESDTGPKRSFDAIVRLEAVKGLYTTRRLRGESAFFWESRDKARWTVFYDESLDLPERSGAHQVIYIKLFNDSEALFAKLAPHSKHWQAVALEASAPRRALWAKRLSAIGFNRICRAGRMQQPPLLWHHDGRPNLAAWVTWTDME